MVSVETAINKIDQEIGALKRGKLVALENALNEVLFEDVYSNINMPPFRQSAMDGYALRLGEGLNYKVIAEIQAGDNQEENLQVGDAVRIFTGAPVPSTANAVIMQEKVEVNDEGILIAPGVNENDNIRPEGEQVKKGEIALKKGTTITPAGIGYLASLGVTEVNISDTPRVTIVSTGNELVSPGSKLEYGQIYESNSIMLKNALKSIGVLDVQITRVKDNYEETFIELGRVIDEFDVVIISGGISVGDYDFVGKSLMEIGVKEVFYKVKQKPGKPLFFGKKEEKLIFALPGNPAAALSCFYVYAYPAFRKLQGDQDFKQIKTTAVSISEFKKKGDRAQFLKASYKNGEVEILEGQSSAMLQTFALANAFVLVKEDQMEIKKGDSVEILLLP